jgi:plasmid stabilization system protein ParE
MARFRLTSGARADLRKAFQYVADQGGVQASRRLRLRIRDRLLLLAQQPFIGRPRPEFDPDMRSYVASNTPYIIFCYPRDYGVEIARVWHGSWNVRRLFDQ